MIDSFLLGISVIYWTVYIIIGAISLVKPGFEFKPNWLVCGIIFYVIFLLFSAIFYFLQEYATIIGEYIFNAIS